MSVYINYLFGVLAALFVGDLSSNRFEKQNSEILVPKEKVKSEIVLKADGPGETYELINSVLAPGYDVVETPDCAHPEFGRHIDEIFDTDLNANVFRFSIHVTPDNDRCKKFDRQRNEIKTYASSPDNLKGVEGEKVVYSWKFKLPKNFQSSKGFTHIHQLKAVGGSEKNVPLITFTTRKASPDRIELRYAEYDQQETVKTADLEPFLGTWVEVTEIVVYGEKGVGSIDLKIRKADTGRVLLSYKNSKIRMWKSDADFIRPKWGIYRSLKSKQYLKDEQVLFADFSIKELEN